MPLYCYKCPVCAAKREIFKSLADIDKVEKCAKCHFAMNRQIAAPMVRGDYAGYTCPITGNWVEGRKAHKENLAKHGCRVLETGEKEEVVKRREQEEKRLDTEVETTVERAFEQLPTKKKEQLASELLSGAEAQIVRI